MLQHDEKNAWMRLDLVRELEAVLIEYVERYGLTRRAYDVLSEIDRSRASSASFSEENKHLSRSSGSPER